MDQGLIKQINQRLQEELLKKEIEVVQYGYNELERILEKRHQDIASLQMDIKGLVQKYHNRLKILKASRIT
jgi:predicted component of type VI protein secretion system